jgi:hypothetical protein
MCLTTFICCGCAYGCVPTTLWFLVPTKLLEFCQKSGLLPRNKSWSVAEAESLYLCTKKTSYKYIYIPISELDILIMTILSTRLALKKTTCQRDGNLIIVTSFLVVGGSIVTPWERQTTSFCNVVASASDTPVRLRCQNR